MKKHDVNTRLSQALDNTIERAARVKRELALRSGPLQPGDIIGLEGTDGNIREWLVYASRGGEVVLIAVDDVALLGRGDARVPESADCAPLYVRGIGRCTVSLAKLGAPKRTAYLRATELAGLRKDLSAKDLGDRDDDDLDYQQLIEQVEADRHHLIQTLAAAPAPAVDLETRRKRPTRKIAFAASIAVVVLFGGYLLSQLRAPYSDGFKGNFELSPIYRTARGVLPPDAEITGDDEISADVAVSKDGYLSLSVIDPSGRLEVAAGGMVTAGRLTLEPRSGSGWREQSPGEEEGTIQLSTAGPHQLSLVLSRIELSRVQLEEAVRGENLDLVEARHLLRLNVVPR